jgi:hypothetical protein
MLLAAAWCPAVPVVTAMALIALGATAVVIDRCRRAAAWRGVAALHLTVYTSLYLLFVGAMYHAAFTATQDGFTLLQRIDLAASAAIMVLVVRLSLAVVTRNSDAAQR